MRIALLYKVLYTDLAVHRRGRKSTLEGDLMRYSAKNIVSAFGVLACGVAMGAAFLYVGHTDDAPPVGLTGILLMIGAAALSVRIARGKP